MKNGRPCYLNIRMLVAQLHFGPVSSNRKQHHVGCREAEAAIPDPASSVHASEHEEPARHRR
jgi:hypothetical protein